MNFQKVIRFQYIHSRILRKLRLSNVNSENKCSIYTVINNFYVIPRISYNHYTVPGLNFYSTSALSDSEELVNVNLFEKVCQETLESLTEFFEELIENNEVLKTADVSYSDGVLTVCLDDKLGTYVINRQSPNRQIWLSSPVSGPKRYDFVVNGNYWIYKHDMVPLHKLLQSELSTALGKKIDLSRCLYSKV